MYHLESLSFYLLALGRTSKLQGWYCTRNKFDKVCFCRLFKVSLKWEKTQSINKYQTWFTTVLSWWFSLQAPMSLISEDVKLSPASFSSSKKASVVLLDEDFETLLFSVVSIKGAVFRDKNIILIILNFSSNHFFEPGWCAGAICNNNRHLKGNWCS